MKCTRVLVLFSMENDHQNLYINLSPEMKLETLRYLKHLSLN